MFMGGREKGWGGVLWKLSEYESPCARIWIIFYLFKGKGRNTLITLMAYIFFM